MVPKKSSRQRISTVKQVFKQVPNSKYEFLYGTEYIMKSGFLEMSKHELPRNKFEWIHKDYRKKLYLKNSRCSFCSVTLNKKFTGVILCNQCDRFGCLWHFAKGDLCVMCKYPIISLTDYSKYNEKYVLKTYIQNKKGACLLFAINEEKYNWYTNIPDQIRAEVDELVHKKEYGFFQVYYDSEKVDLPKQLAIKGHKTKQFKTFGKTLKSIYDNKLLKSKEKYTPIYLSDAETPKTEYIETRVGKSMYIVRKYINMVDGLTNMGLTTVNDALHPSIISRSLQYSSYIKHCLKRDTYSPYLKKKAGEPNPSFVYHHEISLDGFYHYKADGSVLLYNAENTNGFYKAKQLAKCYLGYVFQVGDTSSGIRETKHIAGSKGGIDIQRFPSMRVFVDEMFQASAKMINIIRKNTVDYSKYFNSIQMNFGYNIPHGTSKSPDWHFDAPTLFSRGAVGGIYTVHLKSYNAFIVSSDMNPSFDKQKIKRNPLKYAKQVFRNGIVKVPGSCYLIENFSTKWTNHCIISGDTLAGFKDEYNSLLKEHLEDCYQQYWINSSAGVLRKKGTESWVIRAHSKLPKNYNEFKN